MPRTSSPEPPSSTLTPADCLASRWPGSGELLDRLVRVASQLLQAPVALGVIAGDGQPRLARSFGLPTNGPPTNPFWTRILASGKTAAQEDTLGGEPGGGGQELPSWLGVPLMGPRGNTLGCLCVAAHQPRAWSNEEASLLHDLAALGEKQLWDGGRSPQQAETSTEAVVLDHIPHACFAIDPQGRFTYLNQHAEQFFRQLRRRGNASLIGHNIWDEFPEVADSTFARECQQVRAEHRSLEAETFYPDLNRWFSIHVSPGPGDGLSVLVRDVSDRTGLERALRQRAEALVEADRGKDEFLVQLAHEVRNVLATVRNAAHLARRGGPNGGEDEQACALAELEVRRMSRLMDDLLKVSQLVPGTMPLRKERVNLAEVIARSLAATLSSSAGAGRRFSFHLPAAPLWLEADPKHLEQVLDHLLDNAIKFTRQCGQIYLTAEQEAGMAVLRVRDDGFGISAENLPRVFNLFMRAGPGPFRGGLGVGLTLARRIVELHGGSIEAGSDGPGHGSEFTVRLPALRDPPAGPAREREEASAGVRPLEVLVVDDNQEVAQSIVLLLTRWGHEARIAYDGAGALEQVAARSPEVVLLDIGLPGISGYEVAERLRRCKGGETMVLVALTGYDRDEDRRRVHAAGFDHHLVKPVDPEVLKSMLTASAGTPRPGRLGSEA